MQHEIGIKISASGAQQAQSSINALRADVEKMDISAKQAAAALRGVPAQLTDIITSLQGGQAPLTVFLQQGGQLKDMFGGAGAAAKALGGYVLGLISPFTAAAAAVGVMGFAWNSGRKESEAYARALITTGNAAGATASQLAEMAGSIGLLGGSTQGRAAEVIAAMAASAQIGAANIRRFTVAALDMERAGGAAAEKTAKQFSELGNSPLDASVKLNESTNFLTRSTYEQIRALEGQGRMTEAAAAAQSAFAEALESRAPQMEAALGLVERGWRRVADGAKSAWDAVLDVGRVSSIDSQISDLKAQADRLRAVIDNRAVASPSQVFDAIRGKSFADQARDLDAVVAKLRESKQLSEGSAAAEAKAAASVKALADYRKDELQYLSKAEQANRAITKSIVEGVAAGERMDAIQRRVEAIREKYTDRSADGLKSRELEAQADLLARLSGYTATYNNDLQRLIALRNRGAISEALYGDEVRKLVALQPAAVREAKALAAAQEAAAAAYKKVISELDGVLSRQEREVQSLQDQYIAMTAGKEALEQMRAAREGNALAMAEEALQTAYMTAASAEEIVRRQAIIEALKQEVALRHGVASATASQEAERANAEAARKAADEWQRASDQVGQALADALMQGGKSAADYIKGLFRTMVLRPVIQAAVQPYASAALGLLGQQQPQGGGAGGYLQTANGLYSTGSTLSGLYGYGAAAGNYAAVASGAAYGTGFASQQSMALAAQEAGMVSSAGASTAGAWAGYAGWAALAVAAAIQAQRDYDLGFNRDSASNSGTALGDASARSADLFSRLGLNDEWADIISGATLTARLFGRSAPQVQATGVQGTIGAGDFAGQAFADIRERGGLFRSDKNYTSLAEVPQELGRFLDTASKAVLEKAKEYGAALGLPAQALANVSTDIRVTLGDDAAKNQEELLKALGGYGDALVAGWADAIKPLALYGETTVQTIERVGAAIKSTNDVLALLNVGLLDASVSGGQAAAALAAAFGGLDALTSASAAYYQNYFTEAERAAKSTAQLSTALAAVGLALPATREQFRALVQGLDLTTEAGRQQFVVLMGVQQAFAELNPVAQETAQALRSAADVLRERKSLELDLLRLQGDTAAIRAIERAALDASNQALYDQIAALQDTQAAAAQAASAAEQAAAVAADAAAAATQRLKAIADEKAGLELQLLQLQGNTVEIRARERAALLTDEARAIYDQINALKDAQASWQDTGAAAVAAASTAGSAWAGTWQSMADEIKRLRGGQTVGGGAAATLAEFATATAQARAGDESAAARIASLARNASEESRGVSASREEFAVLNARLAASMERTLRETGAPAELLAGLRADANAAHAETMAATAQTMTLLRRVSTLLAQWEDAGMPEVRAA